MSTGLYCIYVAFFSSLVEKHLHGIRGKNSAPGFLLLGEGGWVLQREESPIAKLVMEQFITINQVDWRFS